MSFKPKTTTEAATEEVAKTVVVASHPEQAAIVVAPSVSGDDVRGEITMQDIKLPRLNIVQKVGDLGNTFPAGGVVFMKEILLTDGKTPVPVTVLRIRKQYQENLPYGSDEFPKTFDTLEEVRAAGGQNAAYDEPGYYGEIAHIQLAIQAPEDAPEEVIALFPHTYKEKAYAVAIWTVKSSGYTAAAKPIFTAKGNQLRDGLFHGQWMLSSELRKNAKNSWFVPKIQYVGKHDAEGSAFFSGLL